MYILFASDGWDLPVGRCFVRCQRRLGSPSKWGLIAVLPYQIYGPLTLFSQQMGFDRCSDPLSSHLSSREQPQNPIFAEGSGDSAPHFHVIPPRQFCHLLSLLPKIKIFSLRHFLPQAFVWENCDFSLNF